MSYIDLEDFQQEKVCFVVFVQGTNATNEDHLLTDTESEIHNDYLQQFEWIILDLRKLNDSEYPDNEYKLLNRHKYYLK